MVYLEQDTLAAHIHVFPAQQGTLAAPSSSHPAALPRDTSADLSGPQQEQCGQGTQAGRASPTPGGWRSSTTMAAPQPHFCTEESQAESAPAPAPHAGTLT